MSKKASIYSIQMQSVCIYFSACMYIIHLKVSVLYLYI